MAEGRGHEGMTFSNRRIITHEVIRPDQQVPTAFWPFHKQHCYTRTHIRGQHWGIAGEATSCNAGIPNGQWFTAALLLIQLAAHTPGKVAEDGARA